jgi:N6-adenosine-specific RNA methylase IME4
MIDLRLCSSAELLADQTWGTPDLVAADPPWNYDNAAGGTGTSGSSAVYATMTDEQIADELSAAYRRAAEDCYLAMWVTMPKLGEWMLETATGFPWRYITAGAWGKTGRTMSGAGKAGRLGMGFHWRGHVELVLLYAKGNPRPRDRSRRNLWLAERLEHSEKPAAALDDILRVGSRPGDLVLELYAGESASLPLSCRRSRRNYVGAELSPARHAKALSRLQRASLVERSSRDDAGERRTLSGYLGEVGELVVLPSELLEGWPKGRGAIVVSSSRARGETVVEPA